MSRREEFKSRMKELKQYKDTTGKGYWEWKKQPKVRAYYFGGDNDPEGEEYKDDVFAQFIKKNPMQPGATPITELQEQGRIDNLPYEQNEYQKQFAKAWYTQRAKYDKYKSQLGGDKLDAVLQNVDKSTYQTLPQFAETALTEYARLNNIDRAPNPIEIQMKTEQLQKDPALGSAIPKKYAWYVKPKPIKTKRFNNSGLGWHEGIGHVVGDNSEQILQSAPRIFVKSKAGDKEYDKYANQLNEQHASTWEFRGANAEMLDDQGKRYIDPNRQLNSYDIRKMIEKGATLPVQWRDSGITEAQIAEFLNSFAYNDQEVIDNSSNDYSLQFDKVLTAKNGGQIPTYKEGGDTEDDIMTTIVTNTVRKALERGDIALAKKMLRRGNGDSKEFHYPDNGSITPLLNLYDTPLLGDALSLLDAIKYSVKGDWDNASTSYMDAVTPLALFNKSKLNWKQWGAKKKYIPEYTAIEYQAKKNGTWLKNPDGSDFTGDPREWVVKQSKRFKESFGDKYKEGYTGMRNPYDPNSTLDTYLSSRDRAYTYTQNKREVKKKGDSGVAKLVVPETDTYTVDALGNDWLHLTDKSVNPYNFTNTNQIVSSIQTPTISFKNIRDDGPFGVRDVAEDQFVIKANTPRKSVLYNNGDFDLSNSDIFKTTITPYIGYKLYNKANRENTQSYAIGGETDSGNILGIEVPMWAETLASFVPVLGTAIDIKSAVQNPTIENIASAILSTASDISGLSLVRGLAKTTKGVDKLRKAEKSLSKARKRYELGKIQDYSEINKAYDEVNTIKKQFDLEYGPDIVDDFVSDITKYAPIGLDFFVNTGQQIQKYKEGGETDQPDNKQGWLSRLIYKLSSPTPFIYSNPTQTLFTKTIEGDEQAENIRYNSAVDSSKTLYKAIRKSQNDPLALPIEIPAQSEPIGNDVFDPGEAFFLTRSDQERLFQSNGYRTIKDINVEDDSAFKKQFGTVRGAVKRYYDEGYDVPVYEYTVDSDTTVLDEDVTPIGNFYSASGYTKPKKYISTKDVAFLPHAGNHGNTVYLHKDGKLYVKSWDLNDYGAGSAGTGGAASDYGNIRKRMSNLLDSSGSPFVQRTGYVPLLYKEQYDALPDKVKQKIPNTVVKYLKPIPDDLNPKKLREKYKQNKAQTNKK